MELAWKNDKAGEKGIAIFVPVLGKVKKDPEVVNSEDRIVLCSALGIADKTLTLVHELAHCIACKNHEHSSRASDRAKAEVIAEGAAYIVTAHFGMDSSGESFHYAAKWGRDFRDFLLWGEAVKKTAEALIEMVEASGQKGGGTDGRAVA